MHQSKEKKKNPSPQKINNQPKKLKKIKFEKKKRKSNRGYHERKL